MLNDFNMAFPFKKFLIVKYTIYKIYLKVDLLVKHKTTNSKRNKEKNLCDFGFSKISKI